MILVASTLAVILTNFLTALSFPYLAALSFKIIMLISVESNKKIMISLVNMHNKSMGTMSEENYCKIAAIFLSIRYDNMRL